MDPNRMLTLFTAVQLLLGAGVVYTVFTAQWRLLMWVAIVGALFTTLFGYWYVDARR